MTQDEIQQMANDFSDACAPLMATLQETANVFVKAFDDFAVAMQPTIMQFIDAMQPIYDAIRAQYIAEGAIYGDTHEGLLHWLEVRRAIARHEAEAEYLRLRQWAVADFQRQVRGQG